MTPGNPQLVVFADDWGRHPSSAQHLVRQLIPRWQTLWVNTIGTRRPRLSVGDLKRGLGALRARPEAAALPEGLRVIAPRMYPGFRTGWQRRLNAGLITRALVDALKSGSPGSTPRVAVTTLPITADLVGKLPGVERWVYYCVDDFSVWPGLDGSVMDAMERELVAKADAVVAVSDTLVQRVRSMGRTDVTLLTHGVDLEAWLHTDGPIPAILPWLQKRPGERKSKAAVFWGLIDRRLDTDWLAAMMHGREPFFYGGTILIGPKSHPDRRLRDVHFLEMPGEVEHHHLPAIAARADVLIMPYIDAPVTRAMQPLKLKEYLATYKPVVVRDLPATREWADCCDVVSTAEDFVRICLARAETGLPPEQRAARDRRLPSESWSAKAATFESILRGG